MRSLFLLIFLMIICLAGMSQETPDYLLRSRALSDQGKAGQAIDLLSSAITRIQDNRLYIMRGDAFAAGGLYSEAISDYQNANKLNSGSGEYGLSRMYALKNDVKTALYHLELNIGSQFRKSEKEIMLDPVFSIIENTPDWRLFWKKERYSQSEQKLSEIEYYTSAGKKEEAARVLSEMVSQNPDASSTLYANALVNFSLGKYSESLTLLSKLIPAEKNNENYIRLLAKTQLALGNPSGASDSYSTLIEMGLCDASLLINRAECYRKTGEGTKALNDLSKYLDLYPENKDALRLAGRIEGETGDNLKALEYFSKNLKLHPNDPECYIDRAGAYFISKSWEPAISDYSMALDIQPSNQDAWLNKAISLINTGKTEDACHDFRKALSLGNRKATSYISRYCIK